MDSSSFPHGAEDNRDGVDENVDEREEDELDAPASGSRNKRKGKQRTNVAKRCKAQTTLVRSKVWEHYTRTVENNDKCKCHYCGRIMSCATTSGTSNLLKHLETCKQHIAWKQSRAPTEDQTQGVLDVEGGELKVAKISIDVFKEACNEMLVLGELPLAFIEGLAFKHFCDRLKIYTPHSRRTATREIVEMFVEKKARMRKLLNANKQRVSLTTDIWKAPTTSSSYMVITAHFIDTSWELRKLIIGFKNVADHKGETISKVLIDCLAEWGIDKVFTITVDNATANTSALERFKEGFAAVGNEALVLNGDFLHVRCCAHIINLVVKDGLREVVNSIAGVRNAIQYVRSSTPRLDSFHHRVESGKMTRGSLPLDCLTRWNSTYMMLSRALKFRKAFDRMEAEDKLYNDYFQEKTDGRKRIGPPLKADWDAIDRLEQFLEIFYDSTLVVSASKSVSSPKCYNEIVTIERNLIKFSNGPDEEMRKKATAMRGKFDKYWEGLEEINRLLIIASVFDPRRKMKFAVLCFEKLYGKETVQSKALYDSVMNVLNRLVDEYNSRMTNENTVETTSQPADTETTSQSQSQGNEAMDVDDDEVRVRGYERMDSLYAEMVNEDGFHDTSTELELYLKEKVVNLKGSMKGTDYDILSFWKINAPKFPVLSEIARDVLALQVSSVASESAFSTSGRILDPQRSCLTHYMIEVLMCTEQWLKCEFQLNEKGVVTSHQMVKYVQQQDDLERGI